jgi:hypothetical protein
VTTGQDDLLMQRYLFVKELWESAVAEHHAAQAKADQLRAWRDVAEAEHDAMKDAAGEPGPDAPLCCQRYSPLHHPGFALPGCRWFGWSPPGHCCGVPRECTGRCGASYAEVGPVDTAPLLALISGQGAPPA